MAGTIEITIKHWSRKLPSAMFSRTLFLLNSSSPAMILATNVITSPLTIGKRKREMLT